MLTARQKAFVDHFVTCRNGAEAARRAGYAAPSARITASRLLTSDNIKAALAEKEAELKRHLDISKSTVIRELRAAIGVAEGKMDAGSMIRAWCEIAKMLGLYAPETIKVAVTAESGALQAKFEAMTDEQLIEIAEGRAVAL
jgi:phage terminase small subunit